MTDCFKSYINYILLRVFVLLMCVTMNHIFWFLLEDRCKRGKNKLTNQKEHKSRRASRNLYLYLLCLNGREMQ